MDLQPINEGRENIYKKIVFQIKDLISTKELKPGDKLPPEITMANMLKVSRTSVREAMRTLHVMGIVEIIHGQGTYIAEIDFKKILDQLGELLFLKEDSVLHLFEIRIVLETNAAYWAASRGKSSHLLKLKDIMEKMEELDLDKEIPKEAFKIYDTGFHTTIATLSGNPVMVRIMHSLLDLLENSRGLTLGIEGRVKRSLLEHKEITEAILYRDPEKARNEMFCHLNNIENELRAIVLEKN